VSGLLAVAAMAEQEEEEPADAEGKAETPAETIAEPTAEEPADTDGKAETAAETTARANAEDQLPTAEDGIMGGGFDFVPNPRGNAEDGAPSQETAVVDEPIAVAAEPAANGGTIASSAAEAHEPAASAVEAPPVQAVGDKSSTEASQMGPTPSEPFDERRRIWRPRQKRYDEETDGDKSWYQHKRHVLIFTFSGKPVYSRYGAEEGLVSTTGALSAIVSKMQSFFFASGSTEDNKDSLRYLAAGEHIFVFVERGPLWLVCISRHGDTYQDCLRMLDRVHLQLITILTAGIEKTLISRPNYDMRSLLGGTDNVLNNMIRWCNQDVHVDGFEPLPLPPVHRTAAVEALRGARVQNVLCGFLLAGQRIISIVSNRQYKVNAQDLQALVNLIMSSASLRTGESWTPFCLVHLSDKAFAYAYISYVEGVDVGLVFLSTASDGDQFYEISKQASKIKQTLQKSGCLDAAANAMERCPIDFRAAAAADVGSKGDRSGKKSLLASCPPAQWRLLESTIHAAYFVPSLQQYFSSAVAPPYRSRKRTKVLFRNYGRCRQLLRNTKQPCQICVATDHECFYVFLAAEFHLYLAVPRGTSTGVIGQLYQWFKSQESHILLGNIPTW